jgi:hypothetical protein
MSAGAKAERGGSHRLAAGVLVVLATLLTFLAIHSLWINRQVLDTDNWTEASSQMLEDTAIRTALSGYLVDQLYENVDVAAELRAVLPPRAQPLAGPAANALREPAQQLTNQLLQRPRVQALWENANRGAHQIFLNIVEGGGSAVSTNNGVVALDLRGLLLQLEDRVGIGGGLAAKIPEGSGQLTILKSDQLSAAQSVAKILRPLPIVLIALALAAFGGAVALARGRRREVVLMAGFGFIVAGALALLVRSLGGDAVVGALTSTDASKPAVESVWRIGTSLLAEAATATIGYGVVIVFGAWLAGPTKAAIGFRRALAPYLRQPGFAWGGAAAIVLLVLLWGPTPGTRHFVPALVLIALFALGVEALRRQTAREFPDAPAPELGTALRHGLARFRSGGSHAQNGEAPSAPATALESADALVRLERLAALHDKGILTDDEFAEQKHELLAAH